MLLSAFIHDSSLAVQRLYPEREAREIVLRLCEDILGVSRVEHILNPEAQISDERAPKLQDALSRVLRAEPLQYVLGYAEFCGRRFKVAPGVLIPRPETELLVERARPYASAGSRVLDLCTGSGCIAWSIALDCPGTEVVAVDVSASALEQAASQFEGASPSFVKADILEPLPLEGQFDLLLSNPPYIMESEKSQMRPNVLEYEPELALFVPDGDPLLFYRAIAQRAAELLRAGGTALAEINESLAPQTLRLFEDAGMRNCSILEDFAAKPRFIFFQKP